MARRQPRAKTSPAQRDSRSEHGTGFDALKTLRGKLGPSADKRKSQEPGGGDGACLAGSTRASNDDDDSALFKTALADATTLAPVNRVILETPKPPPRPCPRAPEPETHRSRANEVPRNDEALFRFEMRDVVPIKDTGRLDIGVARPRHAAADSRPAPTFDAESLLDHLPSGVSPDDPRALLDWALEGTQPLKADNRAILSTPPALPNPLQREADDRSVLIEALGSPLSLEDRLDTGEETAFLRPGIPRRVLTDLRRGRWVVQGQLDLHGLIRDEARTALATFLGESLHLGRRCVRLIHGKGLGSPGRIPVLKHLSRGWLAQREEILAFCQAPPHDGGGGALLILLRASTAGSGRNT